MPCDISASSRSSNPASPALSVSPAPPPRSPQHSTAIQTTDGAELSLPGDDRDTSVTLPCPHASDTTFHTDTSFSTPKKHSTPLNRRYIAPAQKQTDDFVSFEDDIGDLGNKLVSSCTSPFVKGLDLASSFTSPHIKNELFISEIFNAPHDAPHYRQEHLLYHRMTKRLIHEQGNTFEVRTQGRPLNLMVTKKQRVELEGASDRTKRRWAQEIDEHRSVSSGFTSNVPKQLAREVKRLKKEELDEFLECSGIDRKIEIPSDDIVSMLTHANLSITQLRQMKPYFKKNGVLWPEDEKQREIIQDITEGYYDTQTLEYTDKDGKEVQVPVSYVKNVEKLVLDRLEKLHQFNLLENNGIPEDEIWIKFGGDHGKGSFKFTLQICNVRNPNSKSNTIVLLKADIKDTYDNLFTLMTFISSQIEELKRLTWKGKKMRVFVCGDYDFYCKVFGIAGATGTHFCIWCDITKKQLQEQGGDTHCEARTLERISEQVNLYEDEGMAQKQVMKEYENCINRPMLDIEIDHVVPPYLHILLGLMKRHHELLEEVANDLDHVIMNQEKKECLLAPKYNVVSSLRDYGGNWQEAVELKKRRLEIVREGGAGIREKVAPYNKKLNDLPKTELLDRQGPIAQPLDDIMMKNNVKVQPFHKRSYLGNDCHTYITEAVYETCTNHIVSKVYELTNSPDIRDKARTKKRNLDTINRLFCKLHLKVAHSRQIDESTALKIDEDISEYMKAYREHFPQKALPKHHILEKHVGPWVTEWGFGLALQGESGVELCHQTLAVAERCTPHLRKTERGVKLSLERHLMSSEPQLIASRPVKQTRRRRKKLFE